MHHKLPDDELTPSGASHSPALTSPQTLTCSKCGQVFEVTDRNVLPFCSLRCQQLDLAVWLDEGYGLPFEGDKSGQIVEHLDDEPE